MIFRICSILLILLWPWLATQAQQLTVKLMDEEGAPLSSAVVELLLPVELQEAYRNPGRLTVDQVNKEFQPHVVTVTAGGSVGFPNSDDILHHVYSFSPAKTFNIPLYGMGENEDRFELFDQAGVVEIGCNIHDWMLAYIYVGETDLMAMSDASGIATLVEAPAGSFRVSIWHERLRAPGNRIEREVQLRSERSNEIEVQLQLGRDRRLRRAPSSSRRRY